MHSSNINWKRIQHVKLKQDEDRQTFQEQALRKNLTVWRKKSLHNCFTVYHRFMVKLQTGKFAELFPQLVACGNLTSRGS